MAMAVTNYYSFGGQILGEETGGVRRDYLGSSAHLVKTGFEPQPLDFKCRSESTSGRISPNMRKNHYLTDALGSVTATVTGAGVVENTYRYKPYGEQLAKTGTGSDPKFLWVGRWGYRNNSTTMGWSCCFDC